MSTNGDEEYPFLIIVPFSPKSMSITHNPFLCIRLGGLFFLFQLFVFAWADANYRFLFQLFVFAWADANYRVPTGVDGRFINCGVGWNEPSGVMVTDR